MSAPRLTAAMRVGALIRRVESEGGFATVLARGDSTAGAVLLICAQRGVNTALLEQILGADGSYHWRQTANQVIENAAIFNEYLTKRRRGDPDLWLVELDIADAERFAAEMTSSG